MHQYGNDEAEDEDDYVPCPDCYGMGTIDNDTLVPDMCFVCGGNGRVPNPFAPA